MVGTRTWRATGVALVLLLLLGAEPLPAAPGPSCATCATGGGDPATCAACPAEIRAVLAGARRLTRTSPDLSNDCLALEPLHPMLRPERRRLLSKRLDRTEVENARAHGVRGVRVLPGCTPLAGALPAQVLLGRPLRPEDRLRDDGTPKPTVYVDGRHPGCIAPGEAQEELASRITDPDSPACNLRAALRATRGSGGAIVQIAGGTYSETHRLPLGHGHVLIARDDEPVVVSGWIDLSQGLGPGRPWVKISEDPTGALWALDWSDHGDTGGAAGLRLPLELDGRRLPMAPHFEADTVAPDVDEIALAAHDVEGGATPAYLYANPEHPAACMDSGINVKSRSRTCRLEGETVPCEACREQGTDIRPAVRSGAHCRPQRGTCSPSVTWRTVKRTGLRTCRAALGPRVEKCVLLKLPRGARPQNHAIRSSHTDHGFNLFNDERSARSGVVLRGLRLENVPITAWGVQRPRALSGHTLRLDALELADVRLELLGSHLILENSHGTEGRILVSARGAPLEEVVVRNNVLDRYHGKPLSWRDHRHGPGRAFPHELHRLRPLCEPACAGQDTPRLFSGEERFMAWRGWNKILFNLVRQGAAINASGPVWHTVIAANAFEHGGLQEGILDLPWGAAHVLVHHNWARDGLGTGIRIVGGATDLVISDNQLHRSPGDVVAGAGPEGSSELCKRTGRCDGAHRSILLKPGGAACRRVTLENNLSARSHHGGIAVQACDQLTLRNNTAVDARRLPELLLIDGPNAGRSAQLLDNVASDPSQPSHEAASRLGGAKAVEVRASDGNFLQGCAPSGRGCPRAGGRVLVTTDPEWTGAPAYEDPAADDYHLVGGWGGPDACAVGPDARYAHPGFNYADELCADPGARAPD